MLRWCSALLLACSTLGCLSPVAYELELPEIGIALPDVRDESFEPSRPGAPLLWYAHKDESAFFLFGSVHIGDEAVAAFWPALEEAYTASDEIVMEIDLASLDTGEMTAFIAEHGTLEPPETLETQLSPETWARVEEIVELAGLEREAILPMQPWLLLFSLMSGSVFTQGHSMDQGVDRIVADHAEGRLPTTSEADPPAPATRPIVALETVESQLRVFSNLPRDLQDGLLARFLDPAAAASEPDLAMILGAWRRGDAETLESLLEPEDPFMARFYEHLVFDRNARMTERLVEIGSDGRTRLVVVGVLHMLGRRGIPAMLEQNGYAVELQE